MEKESFIAVEINDIFDFHKLFSILKKSIQNSQITITLNITPQEPSHILMLTQFAIFTKKLDCDVTLLTSPKTVKYLQGIGIFEFIKQNTESAATIDTIESATAMPICRIERETMNNYILSTINYFSTFCPNKDLGMLELCISELINNVYDHSFSPIGAYIFCEYYPNKNIIKMGVSDLGIGIPESVTNFFAEKGFEIMTEIDCVKWALEVNKTVQSIPHNAGKGLDNVNSFVNANGGQWDLYTEKVLLKAYQNESAFYANPIHNFRGTLVQLTVDVNSLNDKSIEDTNFEW